MLARFRSAAALNCEVPQPDRGCLVFWRQNNSFRIRHVEFCLDADHSIGASGGGSRTIGVDRAAAQKVYIKVRQIHGRGMIYRYVNPFLEGEISERTLSEYPDWSASDKDHQRELNSGRRLIRVAQRHDMPLSTELASSFKGIILPNPAYSQQVVDPILANPELIDRKTSAVMDKIRARKGGNKENSKTLDISLNL